MSSGGVAEGARSHLVHRVHIGWWIVVLGGMGVLAVLAFDVRVYAAWCELVTPALTQTHLRAMLTLAVLGHFAEAIYAFRLVQRIAPQEDAALWFIQTLTVGYPSLRLLRRRLGRTR